MTSSRDRTEWKDQTMAAEPAAPPPPTTAEDVAAAAAQVVEAKASLAAAEAKHEAAIAAAAPVLKRFDPKASSFLVEGDGAAETAIPLDDLNDKVNGSDVVITRHGVTYRHVSEVSGTDAAGPFVRWVYRAQAS